MLPTPKPLSTQNHKHWSTSNIVWTIVALLLIGASVTTVIYLFYQKPDNPDNPPPSECLLTTDCPPGNYCSTPQSQPTGTTHAICVAGCDADAMCGGNQMCNLSTHTCQGGVCMTNADCVFPQTCQPGDNAYLRVCKGPPVPQTTPMTTTCIFNKEIGLCVRNTTNILLALGISPQKIVVGVTLNGTSIFPAPAGGLHRLIDTHMLYPGPAFTAGELLDGHVSELNNIDFMNSQLVQVHNDPSHAQNWYNVWIYVPMATLKIETGDWMTKALATKPELANMDDAGLFMSFETPDSIIKKARFVNDAALGGIYIENIQGDSKSNGFARIAKTTLTTGGMRVVGYLTGLITAELDVQSYTHINLGPFTISYSRDSNSFYIDSTNSKMDFADNGFNSCFDWPTDSAGKKTTCIAPAAAVAMASCTPAKPNTLDEKGGDNWSCWNNQPTRTCHTGAALLQDACTPTTPPPVLEIRCVSPDKICGRLASKTKFQNSGVKVLLSIGGVTDSSYLAVACSDTYRAGFVASIAAWVLAFKFDGVDINWKYPLLEQCNGGELPPPIDVKAQASLPICPIGAYANCSVCGAACVYAARAADAANMTKLLRDLRALIDNLKLDDGVPPPLLSATISVQPMHLKSMDYATMSRYVDYFNVETFNFNDANTGTDPVLDVASPLDVFCGAAQDGSTTDSAHCNTTTLAESCGANDVCVACQYDSDCAQALDLRAGSLCDTNTNTCICESSMDCVQKTKSNNAIGGRSVCASGLNRCVACSMDDQSQCAVGQHCDAQKGTCESCLTDDQCPPANTCLTSSTHTCQPSSDAAFNTPRYTYHQSIDTATAPMFMDNWPLATVPGAADLQFTDEASKQKYIRTKHYDSSHNSPNWPNWTVKQYINGNYDYHDTYYYSTPAKNNFAGNQEACCTGGKPDVLSNNKINASVCMGGKEGLFKDGQVIEASDAQYWIPWSPVCDETAVVKQYCGGTNTITGQSNLIADVNCRAWCRDMNDSGNSACDTMMIEYCSQHPTASECACQYYATSPFYKSFMEQLQLSGTAATLGVSLDNPACWVPACEGANLVTVLRPQNMDKQYQECQKKSPDGKNINICTQIINIGDSSAVDIDTLNWNQVCGDYPNPSHQTCTTTCSNNNVCRLGQCHCTASSYPCIGNATCGATGCIDVCKDNTKFCTKNNACLDNSTCACGAGPPCAYDESCWLGVCVKDCVPPPAMGETCVSGVRKCGKKDGCSDNETCENGECHRQCGLCTNNNQCNRTNGQCLCGDRPGCVGQQICTVANNGNGLCTIPPATK